MPEIILNNLTLILPELVLTATALLIIIAHLLRRTDGSIVYYIALAGLVGTVYALTGKTGQNISAFDGMLSIDPFSLYFKIIIVLSTVVVTIMSRYSAEVKSEPHLTGEYYFLILSMAVGMMFMVGSSNLLMMYLTLEMTSLTSYIASGFTRTAKDSSEASLKYLLYGAFSSGVMLYGMSILYGLTGTLNISGINQVLMQGSVNSLALVVSSLFIMVGFGYKISAVPFHYWTPDVYEGAPVTITAFLSVASKAAGFAALVRLMMTVFAPAQESLALLFSILAGLTILYGNLGAIPQTNIKRLLGYSSIGHAGYLLIGLAAFSYSGKEALLYYLLSYLFSTGGAFLVIVALSSYLKTDNINELAGLSQKSPVLAAGMLLSLLSLAGVPPLAGFFAKFYLLFAAIKGGLFWLALIGVLNVITSLYYYLKIVKVMYMDKPMNEISFHITPQQKAMQYFSMFGILALGIYQAPFVKLVELAFLNAVK